MSNAANIVRAACDLALPNRAPVNVIDGLAVSINRGKDYIFEIGVYDKGVWQPTLTQFTSITIQVRTARTAAAVIDVTTVLTGGTVAQSSWEDGTAQHAQIALTGAQTGALVTSSETAYWISIFATSAATGAPVTLAAGWMTAVEDGSNYSASTPISGDPDYMTAAQTLAAIQSTIGSRNTIRDGVWELVLSIDQTTGELVENPRHL